MGGKNTFRGSSYLCFFFLGQDEEDLLFTGGTFHHRRYLIFAYNCLVWFLNKRLEKKAAFSCVCPNEREYLILGGQAKMEPWILREAIPHTPD